MPLVGRLVIAGWSTLCAVFTYFALRESGGLLDFRRRLASWIEPAGIEPAGIEPTRIEPAPDLLAGVRQQVPIRPPGGKHKRFFPVKPNASFQVDRAARYDLRPSVMCHRTPVGSLR